jgi:N-methylhydantoinase A
MAGRTIGVDTGGTFTDVVVREADGSERVHKLPSTPGDPGRAVAEGVAATGEARLADRVVHGTTVWLNALLQGRVARTALVTNDGFADLVRIGRQARPEVYALEPRRPAPLVPTERVHELAQRSWPDPDTGSVVEVRRPTAAELDRLRRQVARSRPESIAIGLLHAYATPEIEARVARALAPLGVPITCSATLLPEHREFERFSTAIVNAALVPVVSSYLERLGAALAPARLVLLASRGGTLAPERARLEPARILVSGPAGGVIGAAEAAREAGFERLVTLDMGGTSADVAFARTSPLAPGEARATVDLPEIGGHPIGLPCLDLHTIGCGGGSIARVDPGGALVVGPESAGADPGPVCYGTSDEPTVTDAHVHLGHLAGGRFLGGRLELDLDAVARAFERLGQRLGVDSRRAAEAVVASARAAMRRAIGVMTLERGQDPRRLPLFAFGGAGGLHASALAGALGMPSAVVPRFPGALSAWGMTRAESSAERALAVLEPLDRWPSRRRRAAGRDLAREVRALLGEDPGPGRVTLEVELDLRYAGQSYHLSMADGSRVERAFHEAHRELYGYDLDSRAIELVALRIRGTRHRTRPDLERPKPRRRPLASSAILGERAPIFDGTRRRSLLVDRESLTPGQAFEGPALVEEFSGTTLVPPGVRARVLTGGHLELTPRTR